MAEPKPQSAPPGAQPAVQQGTQASGPVQHGTPAGAPQAAVGTSPAQGAVPAGTAGTGAPQQPDAPKQPDASKQPDDDGRGARRPGFRQRGRMRRRLSYLRTARELSYRDLG
ncbi:MAG: hypothetical protein KGJ43_08595, partial [Acidobacteriota bacterium]|nr:hypothetical protein [Acidobacteriota bacterium]